MIRKLLTGQGDPRLRGRSPEADYDEGTARVAADLRETMESLERARGLSAPQIGVTARVFVIAGFPVPFVNPELVWTDDADQATDDEGCLSLPGVWVAVRRPRACRLIAHDLEGRPRTFKLRGRDARTALHELDHLDGILITDRAA